MSENLLVPILLQKRWYPKRIKNNPLKSTVSKVQKLGERTSIRITESSRGIIFENKCAGFFLAHFWQISIFQSSCIMHFS